MNRDRVDIGRWRGRDPRDDDWVCIKCNALKSDYGVNRCEPCGLDRVYDEEEMKGIEKCDRTGELIFEEVVLGESSTTDEKLEREVECARQWSRSVVQMLRVDDKLYVVIAVKGPDACVGTSANNQQHGTKMILDKCKPNPQTYSFPTPQSLNAISKEVIKQRFNVDWSGVE